MVVQQYRQRPVAKLDWMVSWYGAYPWHILEMYASKGIIAIAAKGADLVEFQVLKLSFCE